MKAYIDLHTHSTASDGSMRPSELVRHAKEKGLSCIAITDHDTLDGVDEALKEASASGIELIPGVEIGVDFKPEMHILGYFSTSNYTRIIPVLSRLRMLREQRNPKIVDKLNEMGFKISMEDVRAKAGGKVIGRPHIAKALLEKGYVKTTQEAFEKYLACGKPAYFRKDMLSPEEGIKEIKNAGGVPVLAHPVHLMKTIKDMDALLAELKGYGLSGIEAHYTDNTSHDTGILLRLAIKYDFIATGGSDFHGSFKENIDIGVGRGNLKIEYGVLEELKKLF